MRLHKVKKPSVVQQVIDRLTDAIINRELRPGDRIPTEQELADGMGIARNTVREAIKMLTYIGVLEIRRPEGTFVCDGFSENLINPMIYGIILNQSDSYKDLIELREMMEVGVLRLAMEKASAEDMDALREQLTRLRAALQRQPPNPELANLEDNAFHDRIDEICENAIVSKINGLVRRLTQRLRYKTTEEMVLTGRGEEHYAAHERIYRILESKDDHNLNVAIRETYFLESTKQRETV